MKNLCASYRIKKKIWPNAKVRVSTSRLVFFFHAKTFCCCFSLISTIHFRLTFDIKFNIPCFSFVAWWFEQSMTQLSWYDVRLEIKLILRNVFTFSERERETSMLTSHNIIFLRAHTHTPGIEFSSHHSMRFAELPYEWPRRDRERVSVLCSASKSSKWFYCWCAHECMTIIEIK